MASSKSAPAHATEVRDWQHYRNMWAAILEKQTGKGVDYWNVEIARANPRDRQALRDWLAGRGVTGYGAQLLTMERFGYPDWMSTGAAALIDAQYAARPELRAVYDAIVAAAEKAGSIVVQARKTCVSLLTPRRTFARVVAGKTGIALGLRLESRKPGGRLLPSRIHETMPLQIRLTSVKELDAEARALLRQAYEENL